MSILKVKSTHKESQGEFVLIEADTFDPLKHKLYDEKPAGTTQPTMHTRKEAGK